MIPTEKQAKALWEKYLVPQYKRRHMTLVARVARFFADRLMINNPQLIINNELLRAAALTHDIDKNIPRAPGERHPDTAVRILRDEGMEEVAALVATHPLHAILDPTLAPSTWEEKLLFLADKMVKQEILTVDKRFELWRNEGLPAEAQTLINESYPKVKELEREVLDIIGITPAEVSNIAAVAK
jgi:predicted hydrolase (HD superfamily)